MGEKLNTVSHTARAALAWMLCEGACEKEGRQAERDLSLLRKALKAKGRTLPKAPSRARSSAAAVPMTSR